MKIDRFSLAFAAAFLLLLLPLRASADDPGWSTKLDGRVKFYQMTEMGVFIVGTEKSLYAVDGDGGEILWRRKNARLDETDVAPISGTDLALLSFEQSDRTRFEAVDLLSGDTVWRSDKVSGAPMQMALDLDRNILAVVSAKKAKGDPGSGLKRKPLVYVFSLSEGDLLWKREAEREVEMMPARWNGDESAYTFDNYHPPLLLDGRLYLFYEGVVSLDARTGKERISERYRVNEEGLALTEADPVYDERSIYTSGRGRVRAVSRDSGRMQWESQDLGLTPEMMLSGDVLYVRTGGQFTKLGNGETADRGDYGVSAIDRRTGKTLWRYKGADKGITNILPSDGSTILLADRDDLITLDGRTGKRASKVSHGVNRAAFVLINERNEAVVGGTEEIAAFDPSTGRSVWRARHAPPSRGALRIIAAVALRAASLYFRYGGIGMAAYRGARIARAASTLRW
ncbi:MAG TPA: PQQ-binding-like beta-propeller repeat protein, partial [Blastocatellia bacterium]|nr:PQQ-binding-like beta-propeller repeat protein [Blastocatellia bacterium]